MLWHVLLQWNHFVVVEIALYSAAVLAAVLELVEVEVVMKEEQPL